MKAMTIQKIAAMTEGEVLCGNPEALAEGICTDTRKITPGALFIPIVGENFDAHAFIPDALAAGCAASLTSQKDMSADKPLIYVKDTRKSLGKLASAYRQSFRLPLVAITGSVGKTTAKEMTATVLASACHVLKTQGNFNNDIGLPLTLLQLTEKHEAAVIEMGMSGFGEIDLLASIAAPDVVLMTNIGLSHIEMLGSQENIYRAKTEFFPHLRPGGTVIINGDDPILSAHKPEMPAKVISVGTSPEHDIYATDIIVKPDSVAFTLVHEDMKKSITLSVPGAHNVTNALLAYAAGFVLNIPAEQAAHALESYMPGDKRMEFIKNNSLTIINDCYNAAPASVEAALQVLSMQEGRKIAVLGDMKELGEFASSAHKKIGTQAAAFHIDALFTLGENGALIAQGAKEAGMTEDSVFSFLEIETLQEALSAFIQKGDVILVKASRAMALERITAFLTEKNK
ncbi:MAG: UDP-N-acetylmuramoyl-tripeptide--D-alanyl-D-alanine ligase [Clostridia bacterium]|nr:UDP-N-acetylmuramoyl-tripeptide--D-alanyl-D-alanine ligase [Clostridia bacterium]